MTREEALEWFKDGGGEMMNPWQAELIGSIQTLHRYCANKKSCEQCVFDDDGYCMLCEYDDGRHITPDNWDEEKIRRKILNDNNI